MKKNILILIFLFSFVGIYSQPTGTNNNSANFPLNAALSVTIGGDFVVTGTFPAMLNERADQFVTRIFNTAKENIFSNAASPEETKKREEELSRYSFRNILLKRLNGESLLLDLTRFRLDGDFKNNPYLMNDDVLIFSSIDIKRNSYTVSGAVNRPGRFHFIEGDQLQDAIFFAHGINKGFPNVNDVEITRLNADGSIKEIFNIKINDKFFLNAGDQIRVIANYAYEKDFKVLILGETNFNGIMPIAKSGTKLKNIIERSGGFTKDAWLTHAKVLRGVNYSFVIERIYGFDLDDYRDFFSTYPIDVVSKYEYQQMFRMSNIVDEDTSYFMLENELRMLSSGVIIDFADLWNENSESGNFELLDGDIIIVPRIDNTINILGQVSHPGKIKFEEGKDIYYYIKEAGGVGEYAVDDIMVIKGKSREWINPQKSNIKLEPGDFIWVPRTPARSFNYYVGVVANYLSIVGSAATIILLLLQFNK